MKEYKGQTERVIDTSAATREGSVYMEDGVLEDPNHFLHSLTGTLS